MNNQFFNHILNRNNSCSYSNIIRLRTCLRRKISTSSRTSASKRRSPTRSGLVSAPFVTGC